MKCWQKALWWAHKLYLSNTIFVGLWALVVMCYLIVSWKKFQCQLNSKYFTFFLDFYVFHIFFFSLFLLIQTNFISFHKHDQVDHLFIFLSIVGISWYSSIRYYYSHLHPIKHSNITLSGFGVCWSYLLVERKIFMN